MVKSQQNKIGLVTRPESSDVDFVFDDRFCVTVTSYDVNYLVFVVIHFGDGVDGPDWHRAATRLIAGTILPGQVCSS